MYFEMIAFPLPDFMKEVFQDVLSSWQPDWYIGCCRDKSTVCSFLRYLLIKEDNFFLEKVLESAYFCQLRIFLSNQHILEAHYFLKKTFTSRIKNVDVRDTRSW